MTNTTTLILIGFVGLLIVIMVILLIYFVRLYEKVDRLDTSDSHLHLLVGRIEQINDSVHRKVDQIASNTESLEDRMVHIDKFLELSAKVRKASKSSGSDPDEDTAVHYKAMNEKG